MEREDRQLIGGQARREVIELAAEDCTPLFDVTAVMRAERPDAPEDEHIHRTQVMVRDLLAKGFVTMEYDCAPSAGHREFKPMTTEQSERELSDHSNWLQHKRRAPDGRWAGISASEDSLRAFYEREFPR